MLASQYAHAHDEPCTRGQAPREGASSALTKTVAATVSEREKKLVQLFVDRDLDLLNFQSPLLDSVPVDCREPARCPAINFQ